MNIVENIQILADRITPVMLMAAAVAFVVAVVVLTLLLRVLYENYRRYSTKKRFTRKMEEKGLNAAEMEKLKGMMRSECPGNPLAILDDRLTFERAVQRLMAHGRVIANGKELSEREKELHEIRKKLNFLSSKDAALFSTRGLKEGMDLDISVANIDGSELRLAGKVNRERDALLEARLDTEPPEDLYGSVAQVAFFPGKSSFGFTSTVRDIDTEENLIFLEHTLALSRVDKRRFERFEVKKPVEITLREEEKEEVYTMELIDISAGGMALASPDAPETTEYTVFDLTLAPTDIASDTEEARKAGDKDFTARIIRLSETADGRTMYHCEFINLSREDRQYLYKLTKLIERLEEKE